jgi:hypothetical protein
MTRKDYIAIAKRFHYYLAESNAAPHDKKGAVIVEHQKRWLSALAHDIATDMGNDNPRFDRTQFMTACGVTK